jgi:hypothetical protein
MTDLPPKNNAPLGSVTRRLRRAGPPLLFTTERINGPAPTFAALRLRRARKPHTTGTRDVRAFPWPTFFSAIFALSAVFSGHHATIESSNSLAKSSGPAGRGDSFVTRCCGSVPSTSAGMSDDE